MEKDSEENIEEREIVDVFGVMYAGFGVRVLAAIIDSLVLAPLLLLGVYNLLNIKSFPLFILITVLSIVYKPFMEWRFGATVGKLLLDIRVVNDESKPITLNQAIGRYVPWLISQALSFFATVHLFNRSDFSKLDSLTGYMEAMENSPFSEISGVYEVIFIILVGSLMFDGQRQGVHDKIAKTLCLRLEK